MFCMAPPAGSSCSRHGAYFPHGCRIRSPGIHSTGVIHRERPGRICQTLVRCRVPPCTPFIRSKRCFPGRPPIFHCDQGVQGAYPATGKVSNTRSDDSRFGRPVMSLLNDALRKKRSERYPTREAPAPAGSQSGLRSNRKQQWIIVSAGIVLLAAASVVWLISSGTE